jgi:hypothetical protein
LRAFEVDPLAYAEYVDAAAWYEEQRDGLGDEFMKEVECVLRAIARTDEFVTAPIEDLGAGAVVRRELVRRFPYVVVFVENDALRKVIVIRRADSDPQRWWARATRK